MNKIISFAQYRKGMKERVGFCVMCREFTMKGCIIESYYKCPVCKRYAVVTIKNARITDMIEVRR